MRKLSPQESRAVEGSAYYHELALAGIIGPIMFWSVSIILGILQPGYSSVRNTLSALVYAHTGWMQTLDFCFFGLLVILFTLGLYVGVQPRRGFRLSMYLLGTMGLGMFIIGVFPTDIGPVCSLHGYIHHYTVRVITIIFPITCFLMVPSLKADPRWKALAAYTAFCGAMVVVLIVIGVIGFLVGLSDSWVGLYERILTANSIIWVEVMGIRMLFLPASIEKAEEKIGNLISRVSDRTFFQNLGLSSRVIFTKIKSRKSIPDRGSAIARYSRYMAFGAVLAAIVGSAYYRRRKDNSPQSLIRTSPVVNSALCLGVQLMGKRLGLSPVANLAVTIVKQKK